MAGDMSERELQGHPAWVGKEAKALNFNHMNDSKKRSITRVCACLVYPAISFGW